VGYSRFAISLFAILTPFAAVPAFLALRERLPYQQRSRTATLAAGTAGLVLVVAALAGQIILTALGTSLASLRVGGGLVRLLRLCRFQTRRAQHHRCRRRRTPTDGIVPLGLPLVAKPGSISSVIVEMRNGEGLVHAALVIACVLSTFRHGVGRSCPWRRRYGT
jgi:multiple antibiotic resistance protein